MTESLPKRLLEILDPFDWLVNETKRKMEIGLNFDISLDQDLSALPFWTYLDK